MAEIIAAPVAEKIADSLFGVAKKEIGYMWNCKENVKKLKNEADNLKLTRDKVQQQIDGAKKKGDKLIVGVEQWMEDADEEVSKAELFLEQEGNAKKTCLKIGMCGNWATLHRYGKKTVTEMTPALLEHKASGTPYEAGGVSVYTPAPGPLDVYESKDLDDIQTQNSALNDIIKALEDGKIQIIGIYGLGGVGKTTLAKEVVSKVKNTLFADVAFTTVSQTVKVEDIKKDIEEATKRIMNGDKILIILDDVWEKLDLEELCIPINHKNCKILLTSRSERVCQKMNAQSKICVNSLTLEETWILFKRVVGERVETDADLKPIAEEVAKECGGLPLLIQAVGNALKHEIIDSWKAALSRLKKAAPSEIDADIQKAFTRLKLSYDYLESEDAKLCFLLCSMFSEDHDISLEDLVIYGVGLEKFDELDSIEDARGRVQNAVNVLTSSGLLLNSEQKGCKKMHDVVRDVALLIASEAGNNKFLVKAGQGLTEWLPRATSLESYAGISLMHNDIIKLPNYEVYLPHLEIFLVNGNDELPMISDEFIGCMKEVKVLDISWNNISSLPQSLQLLTKLRTLDLRQNKSLHEISTLGKLKDLEILIISSTGITEIPKEIGGLINLRVLKVTGCEDLSSIAPGVISKLLRLEELSIEFKLKFKGASDCIIEVMRLSKLAYLDLAVPSIDDIPAQCFNSEKLKEFVVQIGEYNRDVGPISSFSWSGSYLVLSRQHLVIPLLKWVKKLIEVSRPHVILHEIEDLKNNMMPTLYDEGFNNLEHIRLSCCPNVSCIVDDDDESRISCDWDEGKTPLKKYFMELKELDLYELNKLEVIWKCPDGYISLANLVTLKICRCDKLEKVLTVSVAQGLVNLKDLTIEDCPGLEEVIYYGGGGGEEIVDEQQQQQQQQQQQHDSSSSSSAANTNNNNNNNNIVFLSLAKIYLRRLTKLKRFINYSAGGGGNGNGNCSIFKYPSLVYVEIDECKSMKMWGPGIHETPNFNEDVDSPFAINEAVEKIWRQWKVDDDGDE